MEPNENHGFVVQNSAISLDLCSSKDCVPVSFIASLKDYEKDIERLVFQSNNEKSSVIFWDYYDKDRESFENNLFENYEEKYLKLNSTFHIRNYLKLCKTMCRCSDVEEAMRIFSLIIDVLIEERSNDSDLVVSLLETVGATNEAISIIFTEKGNLRYLAFILLHLVKAKQDLFGFWLGSSTCPTDFNLVSQYLFLGHYTSVLLSVKYGLKWRFCESVLVDYCKQLNPLWTVDSPLHFDEPNQVSVDRFFLVLQTFFVIWDWKVNGKQESLEALLTVWRSVPYPFVTPQEMSLYLQNFTSPSSEISPQEISDICEVYDGVFWNDQEEPVAPRSLQDLCRCAIRNRLSENFQLPCGVSELNLPSIVRSYLKLER